MNEFEQYKYHYNYQDWYVELEVSIKYHKWYRSITWKKWIPLKHNDDKPIGENV